MGFCNRALSHSSTPYDVLGEMFKLKLSMITPVSLPHQPHPGRPHFCRALYLTQKTRMRRGTYSIWRWGHRVKNSWGRCQVGPRGRLSSENCGVPPAAAGPVPTYDPCAVSEWGPIEGNHLLAVSILWDSMLFRGFGLWL